MNSQQIKIDIIKGGKYQSNLNFQGHCQQGKYGDYSWLLYTYFTLVLKSSTEENIKAFIFQWGKQKLWHWQKPYRLHQSSTLLTCLPNLVTCISCSLGLSMIYLCYQSQQRFSAFWLLHELKCGKTFPSQLHSCWRIRPQAQQISCAGLL